jgi:hypothetical protein
MAARYSILWKLQLTEYFVYGAMFLIEPEAISIRRITVDY